MASSLLRKAVAVLVALAAVLAPVTDGATAPSPRIPKTSPLEVGLAEVLTRRRTRLRPLDHAELPKVFVVRESAVKNLSSTVENSRPATRLFVQWLDANGLSTLNCSAAHWIFLPTDCTQESQALESIEEDEVVPSTTGGEPGRDCVRRFREHGRIASGVCSGDNGYPSPLGARDRGLVRVAMYGLIEGEVSACEGGQLCKGAVRPSRDVTVPGLQTYGLDEQSFANLRPLPPRAERPRLLAFSGSFAREREGPHTEAANLRGLVKKLFEADPDFDFRARELVKRQASLLTFAEMMGSSAFCLAPHGMHGGWGSRWKYAVMAGCIPVIFDHPHVGYWYPFEHLFPREAYSIALNYSQVPDLDEILRSVPEQVRQEKRRYLRGMRRVVAWTAGVRSR